MDEQDIFDKIMDMPILRIFKPFYQEYREGLLYLFFGGITFFLVILIYSILVYQCGINILVANALSWISGVVFSFFTTRKWVFLQKSLTKIETLKQLASFLEARVATLLLQEFLLFLLVTLCALNGIVIKTVTEILNIILNYLVSKFIIFRSHR